jgi:hypothetical protein
MSNFDLSKIADSQTAAELLRLAVRALEVIGVLTKSAGVENALAVLHGVQAVVTTVEAGFEGKVSPEVVKRELGKMIDRVTANDLEADAALRERFDVSETD